MKKGLKIVIRVAAACVAVVLVLLAVLNPNRGSFNQMVFEGNLENVASNHEIANAILETNRKDYNDASHPFVQGKNYFLFSVYDIHVDDSKTYHILGILQSFKLMNP